MPANDILQEAQKLRKVCNNLRIMAEKHTSIWEELQILSGSVGTFATLLEVLVDLNLNPSPESDLNIN